MHTIPTPSVCVCLCVPVCVYMCVCVCVCVVCVCVYASIVPLLVCACILINTFLAVFPAATDQEIEAFWEIIHSVDDAVTRDDHAKRVLTNRPALKQFIEHCCHVRHYQFAIKKCGDLSCNICKPPRLPQPIFQSLHHIPDPVPDSDGLHYKPFEDLYAKSTTEQHRPSLQVDSKHRKSHGIPFSPSAQTARTVSQIVMCSECLRPRVIYAQKKLSFQEVLQVERILEDVYFTCGSSLQDIDSSHGVGSTTDSQLLSKVSVRANLTCNDPVEISFYSSESFPDVCVHCACVGDLW